MNEKELQDKIIGEMAKKANSIEDVQMMLKQFFGPTIEKMMKAEMDEYLGYKKHAKEGYNTGNSRNGNYKKKVLTTGGEMDIEVPRDRNGDFEPKIIPKYETRTNEIEQKIINMYGLGLTTRDIQKHILDIYGAEVSPSLISDITDKILPEIKERQSRPLEECYPIIYLDAIHYKVKDGGKYDSKGVYIVLGIGISGKKDIIGLYIGDNESASFWQKVCNDIASRGVKDIMIACVDGLNGFSKAIHNVFPEVEIQRCIIHQIRYTMGYINYKDSKEFMQDLKQIYQASTLELAEENLQKLDDKWRDKYSISVNSWKNNWGELSTYFVYPWNIRRLIYTTNTIEGYNRQLRKYTKNRNVFPDGNSLLKLLYLVTKNIEKKWTKPVHNWGQMLGQFESFFPERITKYLR